MGITGSEVPACWSTSIADSMATAEVVLVEGTLIGAVQCVKKLEMVRKSPIRKLCNKGCSSNWILLSFFYDVDWDT